MKNVDHIIRYLSGESNQEEAFALEQRLASDPGFKEEFEEVSAAYELIRDQLQKQDLDQFRNTLLEVIEQPEAIKIRTKRRIRLIGTLLFLAAASLAILLVIFLSNPDPVKTYSRYYHPEEDAVLLAINQGTRGNTEEGILHFQMGHYEKTRELMGDLMEKEPENQMAQLYYLLASLETGKEEQALEQLAPRELNINHQMGQAICWYRALALIKTGQVEEAKALLLSLVQTRGPYQSNARRLQKNLLK